MAYCIGCGFYSTIEPLFITSPIKKSGSLGSAILRNGVLMSLTFPILPIIYQQKIMMHIGKDYSWLGLVTGEVIIGFFNWVLCGGSLLGR